ncbi:hypothetical protein PAPHI01_2028 [Pancytospora philotis]|nr:hypothetical protein PAPHI01_2028 [Pancytospora philotis]
MEELKMPESRLLEKVVSPDAKISLSTYYRRVRRKLWLVVFAVLLVVATIFTIKKFEAIREELICMKSTIEYVNREMDRILLLGTREEQNKAFRNLKPEFPIKPVRMTLTTAVFKYTNTVPHVILKRVIYNPLNKLNEDYMSLNLKHPHVVQTLKAFRTKRILPDGSTQTLVWIFSEMLDVKLSQSSIRGNEDLIRQILRDVLRGIVHLHSLSIAHLDLKIGNVMGKTLDKRVVYKLIDFGYAQLMPKAGHVVIPNKNYGTYPYKAPEIVLNNRHGLASDIWSIGAIAWFLSLQYTPFYFEDYRKDLAGFKRFIQPRSDGALKNHRFTFAAGTSNGLKKFVKDCMQLNPDSRPTAQQLLEHPFILGTPCTYHSQSDEVFSDSTDGSGYSSD